jgi:hypothetical protein
MLTIAWLAHEYYWEGSARCSEENAEAAADFNGHVKEVNQIIQGGSNMTRTDCV